MCHCATDWCLCLAGRHCRWLLGGAAGVAVAATANAGVAAAAARCICFLAINVACSRRSHRHQRLQFLCLLHSLSRALVLSLSPWVSSLSLRCALYLSDALFFCALVLVCAVGVVEECLGGNVNALPLLPRSLTLSLSLPPVTVCTFCKALLLLLYKLPQTPRPLTLPTAGQAHRVRPCKRVGFSCPLPAWFIFGARCRSCSREPRFASREPGPLKWWAQLGAQWWKRIRRQVAAAFQHLFAVLEYISFFLLYLITFFFTQSKRNCRIFTINWLATTNTSWCFLHIRT